jgi:PAS domain S-box-containing protein
MAMTPSGMRTEEALRETQRQLASELAATRQLQQISIQLINASDPEALYAKILDAAVAIMTSDFAIMQMFYPERGELRLLGYRGFTPAAAAFWEWVGPGSGSVCGVALATGARSIVPDIELCDFIAGSEGLEAFRQAGIRAGQATPLVSRAGRLLGMISTQWRNPHQPSERDLRLLDVLARQAADLIERKQTELTDQRLAAIVDSSHDAIVSKDLNGIVTSWNRGAERLFGYAASEIIGRPITTLFAPDRHDEEVRILDCIRRGGRVDPYETVRMRSDASLVDVSVSVSPLRNAAGEIIGASTIARDITQRKLAELALAERNTQLELASKTARVGSYAINLLTGLVNLSPGCATILGLPDSAVEVSRENARKLVHPEDLAQLDTARDQAFFKKQHEFVAQARIIRANDGEVRWVEARSLIFYDQGGQPLRYIAVIIDTTERKLAEQALAERNAQLGLAGRAALVGSYAYDVHKGTMQVSTGYAAIHGLSEGTTETTISEWRARVHPEDLARAEGLREQAFAERRNEDNAEYRIVLSNGEVRWIERRGTILYGKKGRPERVVGVNIDVTERKRSEERQRVLVAELDHRVKNVLATVNSIITQTRESSSSHMDFMNALNRRIDSLARTHELLSKSNWHGASLAWIYTGRDQLTPSDPK